MNTRLAAATAALLVATTACSGADPDPTRFEAAYATCEAESEGMLVDDGKSLLLTIDTENPAREQLLDESLCIFNSFNPPQSVQRKILQTSDRDGFQQAEWDGIEAEWKYRRDTGITITLTDTQAE